MSFGVAFGFNVHPDPGEDHGSVFMLGLSSCGLFFCFFWTVVHCTAPGVRTRTEGRYMDCLTKASRVIAHFSDSISVYFQ